MKQKKGLLTVLLIVGLIAAHAQQSVNASGSDAKGSGGTAAYSVGQVAYTYISGSSNQGVQQPFEFFVTGIDNRSDINLSVSVFPNPVAYTVNLKLDNVPTGELFYQLYDVNGRQLLNSSINNLLTAIPVNTLAQGSYILKICSSIKTIKTFTLIKNQ